MHIIILAAGRGSRLGRMTENKPKALIDICGATILDHQLKAIAEGCPSVEVIVVTGFGGELIDAEIRSNPRGVDTIPLFNPFYAVSNNLVSLWLALKTFPGDFAVVNGDNVFTSGVIHDLAASEADACLMTNRKESYDEDDMKVIVRDGRIQKVSKKVELEQANMESIGVMKFQGPAAARLRGILDDMVKDPANMKIFYLEGVQRLIDSGQDVAYKCIKPGEWGEVDYPEDVANASRLIESWAR